MEALTLNWPAGEDEFLLRLGELEALDDITPEGVLDFRYRLSLGGARGTLGYSPVRIREVIACLRLGLIGAGMERKEADRKAKQGFEDGDISALNVMCYEIITHSLKAKAHDTLGEKTAEENPPASSSPPSTETAS